MALLRVCSVEDCGKPVEARGWCAMHYRRWRVHGDIHYPDTRRKHVTCTIEGCERPHVANGLCHTHDTRRKRNGDPLVLKHDHRPPGMRFAQDIDPQPNGCWWWKGPLNQQGYALLRAPSVSPHRKNVITAHLFIYETLFGPIPEGMQIDHVCHSRDESCAGGPSCTHRRCVNPMHLEVVTPKENHRRGRSQIPKVYLTGGR